MRGRRFKLSKQDNLNYSRIFLVFVSAVAFVWKNKKSFFFNREPYDRKIILKISHKMFTVLSRLKKKICENIRVWKSHFVISHSIFIRK